LSKADPDIAPYSSKASPSFGGSAKEKEKTLQALSSTGPGAGAVKSGAGAVKNLTRILRDFWRGATWQGSERHEKMEKPGGKGGTSLVIEQPEKVLESTLQKLEEGNIKGKKSKTAAERLEAMHGGKQVQVHQGLSEDAKKVAKLGEVKQPSTGQQSLPKGARLETANEGTLKAQKKVGKQHLYQQIYTYVNQYNMSPKEAARNLWENRIGATAEASEKFKGSAEWKALQSYTKQEKSMFVSVKDSLIKSDTPTPLPWFVSVKVSLLKGGKLDTPKDIYEFGREYEEAVGGVKEDPKTTEELLARLKERRTGDLPKTMGTIAMKEKARAVGDHHRDFPEVPSPKRTRLAKPSQRSTTTEGE
jgi:hypothetical protein